MRELDKRTRETFDQGYKALGQVVYHFQELERELGQAVSFLIDPVDGERADIVVSELSFKQLTHIGYSLFEIFEIPKKNECRKEWTRILGLCLNAENHRNRLLHSNYYGSYVGGPNNMEFMRYKKTAKFKRGSRFDDEQMNATSVKAYLKEIGGVEGQISEFMGNTFPGWNERRWEPATI
ncbi:MAG: hypothetical protein ACRCXD_11410 [Luteolibacter sp.]